jgi:protein FRA10AC1
LIERIISGLCPPCSKKLNYHHKRKEAKRGGSSKRPLTDAEAQEASSSSKLQKLDSETAAAADKMAEGEGSKPVDEAEAWKDTGGDQPVKSREMEFQEYLNDLFI